MSSKIFNIKNLQVCDLDLEVIDMDECIAEYHFGACIYHHNKYEPNKS